MRDAGPVAIKSRWASPLPILRILRAAITLSACTPFITPATLTLRASTKSAQIILNLPDSLCLATLTLLPLVVIMAPRLPPIPSPTRALIVKSRGLVPVCRPTGNARPPLVLCSPGLSRASLGTVTCLVSGLHLGQCKALAMGSIARA